MPQSPLTPEVFRDAERALANLPADDVGLASQLVGEVLLAQGESRLSAASPSLIDSKMTAAGATADTAAVPALHDAPSVEPAIKPLDVLRHGPRSAAERASVSALFVRHLGRVLEGEKGADAIARHIAALDWLEFVGPYEPYTAARHLLGGANRERFEAIVRDAPVTAQSDSSVAAIRALRALASPADGPAGLSAVDHAAPTLRDGEVRFASARPKAALTTVQVAGEVEGLTRGWVARILGIATGWSCVRGAVLLAARWVFSWRRPMTLTLDGALLRIVGHSEILGRTIRTFDERYPIDELLEIRRETRFPALPIAISLVCLATGAFFGARAVIEGAGAAYFPLIGIGIGLLLGGLAVDVLMRALFPGVRSECRVVLRAREARAVTLTNIPIDEAERLLDAIDQRFGAGGESSPASTGARSSQRPRPVRAARAAPTAAPRAASRR